MMRFGANRDSYTDERTASHDGREKSHTASVRIDRVRGGWPSSSDTTLRTRRVVLGKGDREGTLLTFYFRFDAVSTISMGRAALPSDPGPDTIRWQPDGRTRYSYRMSFLLLHLQALAACNDHFQQEQNIATQPSYMSDVGTI